MKWPWVSRRRLEDAQLAMKTMVVIGRLEDAQRQVEWLQQELKGALDKRDRIDRVDAGMSELPREQPRPREPMPEELSHYINGFHNKNQKRMMRGTAYKRHADGETWVSIVADVVIPDEPQEIILQAEDVDEGTEEEAESGTGG